MHCSLKTQIIVHICYREVFNAPVSIEKLKNWIGISNENSYEMDFALSELQEEGLIEYKNGYFVSKGLTKYIDQQFEKNKLSKELIESGTQFLNLLSKFPIIKFIGISGSLAADNPTPEKNGLNKGNIDIDLFIICYQNTVWLFSLFERIFTNLYILIFKKHKYCFNYVTDESFMEIINMNFYTATELINLKVVYGSKTYQRFVTKNLWYQKYYKLPLQTQSLNTASSPTKSRNNHRILTSLNHLCFFCFNAARSFKRLDLKYLKEMSAADYNPKQKTNLKRVSNEYGGYQEKIKERFKLIFNEKFSAYYSDKLLLELFPERTSYTLDENQHFSNEITQHFEKYTEAK